MKKYIAIALLCLFTTISYGQTKEETISWLKEKIEKNLENRFESKGGYVHARDLKLIDITACEIIISYTTEGRGAFGVHTYVFQLPTEGVTIDYRYGFSYGAEKIAMKSDGEVYHKYNTERNFAIRNGEDDLLERIQKALDHLATFCPKKKETF
ncbi:MAG: hypothetical protein ACOH1N_08160 [Lutibacter sp.]